MKPILLLCCALFSFNAQAQGSDFCAGFLKRTDLGLQEAMVRMEPEEALQTLFGEAGEAMKRCEGNAEVAYMHLRIVELSPLPIVYAPNKSYRETWQALTDEHARLFPRSARIATVRARAWQTVAAAEAAVALDANYGPAKVALAATLLRAGRVAEAETAIRGVTNLAPISDGFTVLARVLYAKGDMPGAIRAAKLALSARTSPQVEEDYMNWGPAIEAREILGFAYLKAGDYPRAARALINSAPESKKAADALAHASPKLRAAAQKIYRRHRP